jgi:hypothetical protein
MRPPRSSQHAWVVGSTFGSQGWLASTTVLDESVVFDVLEVSLPSEPSALVVESSRSVAVPPQPAVRDRPETTRAARRAGRIGMRRLYTAVAGASALRVTATSSREQPVARSGWPTRTRGLVRTSRDDRLFRIRDLQGTGLPLGTDMTWQ